MHISGAFFHCTVAFKDTRSSYAWILAMKSLLLYMSVKRPKSRMAREECLRFSPGLASTTTVFFLWALMDFVHPGWCPPLMNRPSSMICSSWTRRYPYAEFLLCNRALLKSLDTHVEPIYKLFIHINQIINSQKYIPTTQNSTKIGSL